MDINPYSDESETIKAAIGSILPTAHFKYNATATPYAIFMFYNSLPEVLASGKNHRVGVYGDIDIFSKTDLNVGAIITALLVAGIEVRDCRDVDFDAAIGIYHKLIEFYIPVKR